MDLYVKVDASGRVAAASCGFHCGDGELIVEIPDGFVMAEARDWRVEDGALVYDPLPAESELPEEDGVDVAALQARVLELEGALDALLTGVTE